MPSTVCLDLEGVLIPELWPYLAERTGIAGLRRTTREEPDYDRLVASRIRLLRQHGLRLGDLQGLLAGLAPLEGAAAFVERLRQSHRVLLVSDAFEEMAWPLWCALGRPEWQCHRFECDADGYIVRPHYRRRGGKEEVLATLTGGEIVAVGDAFNDLVLLRAADRGFLFRPSAETRAAASGLAVVETYREILQALGLAT